MNQARRALTGRVALAFFRPHSTPATDFCKSSILYLRDVIFSFNPAVYQSHIEAWIERVAKPPGEGFTKRDFEMHVREEHSTFAWIVEGMLQRAGFEIVEADCLTPESAQYVCKKIPVESPSNQPIS